MPEDSASTLTPEEGGEQPATEPASQNEEPIVTSEASGSSEPSEAPQEAAPEAAPEEKPKRARKPRNPNAPKKPRKKAVKKEAVPEGGAEGEEAQPAAEGQPWPTEEGQNPEAAEQPPAEEEQPITEAPTPEEQAAEARLPFENAPQPAEAGRQTEQERAAQANKAAMPKLEIGQLVPAIAAILVAIIIIGASASFLFSSATPVNTTTSMTSTTSTSTTTISFKFNLTACTHIDKPGQYYLANNVTMQSATGPCILITSKNVLLVGNNYTLTGNGPYSGVGPFSYGVLVSNATNVTVTRVAATGFSYGIYTYNASNSLIRFNNASKDILSGIALVRSRSVTVADDKVTGTQSDDGGIFVSGGGGNRLLNDTSSSNAHYGIMINSTQNSFANDTFSGNPVDLICNTTAGLPKQNDFYKMDCRTNLYCSTATCKSSNLPANLDTIKLSPGPVTSCGKISAPGRYYLTNSLNVSNFLNTSNPLSKGVPCIEIAAQNVNLTCSGNRILNAGYGVYVLSSINTTVGDCAFVNSNNAIRVQNSYYTKLNNINISGSGYGINLYNVTGGAINNAIVRNMTVGLSMDSVIGFVADNVRTQGGTYGVYINGGSDDAISGGYAYNGAKADVYCTQSVYNSSANLFQGMSCGLTDCTWATCDRHTLPSLTEFPISSCMNITKPGNYTLTSNVLAKGTCFTVNADNVNIDCGKYTMSGNGAGTAIYANSVSYLSVRNCSMISFADGVNAVNSSHVTLRSLRMNSFADVPVYFKNVSQSTVVNVTAKSYLGEAGFLMYGLNSSSVSFNFAQGSVGDVSGFVFVNSINDRIFYNNATSNPTYGFSFVNSKGNSVFNNSAFSNRIYDYYCAPGVGSLYANSGETNFGITKGTCNWLVLLSASSQNPSCASIGSVTYISLSSDLLYPYGNTCYNVYDKTLGSSDGTTINCNGHTVFATSGGSFVNVVNASGVVLENCVLRNFTTGISTTGTVTKVLNSTFEAATNAIWIGRGGDYVLVSNVLIYNSTSGVLTYNANFGSITNTSMSDVVTGISTTNAIGFSFVGVNAMKGKTGIYMSNSVQALLQNDALTGMTAAGLQCAGSSTVSTSNNRDAGGIVCSSNRNCAWVTSPTCS